MMKIYVILLLSLLAFHTYASPMSGQQMQSEVKAFNKLLHDKPLVCTMSPIDSHFKNGDLLRKISNPQLAYSYGDQNLITTVFVFENATSRQVMNIKKSADDQSIRMVSINVLSKNSVIETENADGNTIASANESWEYLATAICR